MNKFQEMIYEKLGKASTGWQYAANGDGGKLTKWTSSSPQDMTDGLLLELNELLVTEVGEVEAQAVVREWFEAHKEKFYQKRFPRLAVKAGVVEVAPPMYRIKMKIDGRWILSGKTYSLVQVKEAIRNLKAKIYAGRKKTFEMNIIRNAKSSIASLGFIEVVQSGTDGAKVIGKHEVGYRQPALWWGK